MNYTYHLENDEKNNRNLPKKLTELINRPTKIGSKSIRPTKYQFTSRILFSDVKQLFF